MVQTETSILLIEDDPVAAEIFGEVLREARHSVDVAIDAESALSYLERSIPAAILLDLRLPTINGHELLRRIRANARLANVPVAVITGDYFLDEAVTADLSTLGARVYFKPIWENDLMRIVGNLLNS